MIKQLCCFSFLSLMIFPVAAEEVLLDTATFLFADFEDNQGQELVPINPEPPSRLPESKNIPVKNQANQSLHLSDQELLANPELLQHALDSAIELNNFQGIKKLLPLYRHLPKPDRILILYGEALLARAEGRHRESVRKYREIIAINPNLMPMRLQLAVTLFENHENTAAMDQFEKVRSSQNLPTPVQDVVNQYIEAIQKRSNWSISANLQYTQDDNINNAPKKGVFGRWQLPKPESAHGVAYGVGADKVIPIKNNWLFHVRFAANGEAYWDNHQYDELITRVSGGVGWRNIRSELALLPFFELQRQGNQAYARMPGVRVEGSHWFNPQWQLLGSLEYGQKRHRQNRRFLDGQSFSASSSLLHLRSAKQYWLLGTAFNRETAKDKSSAYRRAIMHGAWGQEWYKGLSSFLQVGVAKKQYDEADFTDIKRQDKEYFANTSIWLRDLHYRGFTPRLTFSWYRDKSNHFMYDYQKTRTFIEVGKKF